MQSPQRPTLNASWPAEAETVGSPSTMVIPRRNARSPRTRLRRNLERSMTRKAEVSAVMTKLKVRTDKCNAEVATQAQKESQNGDR